MPAKKFQWNNLDLFGLKFIIKYLRKAMAGGFKIVPIFPPPWRDEKSRIP